MERFMSESSGFPATLNWPASTTTPLVGVITGTATSPIGPFVPDNVGRPVYLTLNATTAATGSIALYSSSDGGTTMYPITIGGRSWLDINLVNKSGIIWNETADTPYSTRITYYLVPNISSGSITYKLYQ